MEKQKELPLMGRLDGPSVVPTQYVKACKSYREAVRVAAQLGRVNKMPPSVLADHIGTYKSHASDYLNSDDKPGRRNLPAEAIHRFEMVVGNTLVSQWLAAQSNLTVLEELSATRAVA